jgi:predicted Zn-dependent peptidase
MQARLEDGVRLTVLDNGLRVVTERMPEARSVTTGFWVGVGGRDEPAEIAGASHFLEHLLFKGTEERSAREIAAAVDAVGGEMNAYTAREHTAYYTRLPASALGFGLGLLTDVLSAPALRPHEVDAEREVILEEILLSEDTPDDRVHTALYEALFPDHPLGREVLGNEDTVEAMTRDDVAGFFAEHYRPANLVVAAAGALEHDDVVAGVSACLAGVDGGVRPPRHAPERPPVARLVERKTTEQAHLALGWRAFDHEDPDRYALGVLNQVIGGGMSSRLFQEVREERGLAYAVYSYVSSYVDAGVFGIYAGTSPAKAAEVLDVIGAELDRLLAGGITDEERRVAVGYLEGSLLLGLEDSGSRMARLGRGLLTRGEVTPVDEHVERLRAVTSDDVGRVIDRVLTSARSFAAVGPESGVAALA